MRKCFCLSKGCPEAVNPEKSHKDKEGFPSVGPPAKTNRSSGIISFLLFYLETDQEIELKTA